MGNPGMPPATSLANCNLHFETSYQPARKRKWQVGHAGAGGMPFCPACCSLARPRPPPLLAGVQPPCCLQMLHSLYNVPCTTPHAPRPTHLSITCLSRPTHLSIWGRPPSTSHSVTSAPLTCLSGAAPPPHPTA